MALIDQLEKAQGQALVTLADTQKRALDLNEKVADVIKDRVPPVKVPFSSALPTPAQGVKLYFDFAGKLLATNRKFAEGVLAAWSEPAPKASAPRATAPKATTQRARKAAPKARAKAAA